MTLVAIVSTSAIADQDPANLYEDDVHREACAALIRAAVEFRLSNSDLTGRYYCADVGESKEYIFMSLRYRVEPDELVGSNLIGWYAIRVSDGRVFKWDDNEQVAVPLTLEAPFEE